MTVLIAIETQQSDGTVCRVALVWTVHSWVSWLTVIGRLF